MGRYVLYGALCLVVRGRHIGGVISWGRHDRKLKVLVSSGVTFLGLISFERNGEDGTFSMVSVKQISVISCTYFWL